MPLLLCADTSCARNVLHVPAPRGNYGTERNGLAAIYARTAMTSPAETGSLVLLTGIQARILPVVRTSPRLPKTRSVLSPRLRRKPARLQAATSWPRPVIGSPEPSPRPAVWVELPPPRPRQLSRCHSHRRMRLVRSSRPHPHIPHRYPGPHACLRPVVLSHPATPAISADPCKPCHSRATTRHLAALTTASSGTSPRPARLAGSPARSPKRTSNPPVTGSSPVGAPSIASPSSLCNVGFA